jgi:membrane protein YdbS with pleckstrin-like domain
MTNSPAETPDSPRDSTITDAPAVAEETVDDSAGDTADETADPGTFDRLVEPRSENRLALEAGVWHQISPKYVWVQLISSGSFLAIVIAATLVLTLGLHQTWAWIPGGIMTVLLGWTLAIMPRQARAIGYQLRADDLVFRRGILWQRFVAVPYGRMQLVDITHGPLDRGFGIAQLKFVTAAAATGVVIPGLEQATAETLRDHLIAVAESRRTGL